MGSLERTRAAGTGSAAAYRCSKAGLNMLTLCLAATFPRVTVAAVHPGWVQVAKTLNTRKTDSHKLLL